MKTGRPIHPANPADLDEYERDLDAYERMQAELEDMDRDEDTEPLTELETENNK